MGSGDGGVGVSGSAFDVLLFLAFRSNRGRVRWISRTRIHSKLRAFYLEFMHVHEEVL